MQQNELVYVHMKDSKGEVADYLTLLRIYWIYKSPIFMYDEKNRPPEFGLQIFISLSSVSTLKYVLMKSLVVSIEKRFIEIARFM